MKNKDENEIKWRVLKTVPNRIEFEIISGIMSMAKIPVVKKIYGIDEFVEVILGVPISGIDILVPEDRLKEAQKLLDISEADLEKQIEKEEEYSIKKIEKENNAKESKK